MEKSKHTEEKSKRKDTNEDDRVKDSKNPCKNWKKKAI